MRVRFKLQSITIAQQLAIILAVTFLLIIAFAIRISYEFSYLSADGARLINNLQRTSVLNQELANGNAMQSEQLRQQFESVDPLFPESFRTLTYTLGLKYTEYLKLDIGEQERKTVESIKGMQSEWGILSMQIFELLRRGDRLEASIRFRRLTRLESEIRAEFEKLSGLQLNKLHEVVNRLNRSAANGFMAVFALVVAFVLLLGVSSFLMRRHIIRPIHELLRAYDLIRQGNFNARASVARMDEFGRLTQGFNFMAESLAQSYADLEHKVDERTRQLHEAQRRLIQAEKMSAVGQLVSGVAHELNNPLMAISGFAELLRFEMGVRKDCPQAVESLEHISSQVERCRRIVANLLQFARRQEPHLEAMEINVVIDQVLKLREYELGSRNISLIRDFDPSNPVLCADPQKIQQVALNLLNNAYDAIQEAGRAGTIWIRTMADADSVLIEFRDNGTGISDPEKAFDPFYTTKKVGAGTGLGLSVCYGIIQEHGGEIQARNWENGARVTIKLPIGSPETLGKRKDLAPQQIAAPRKTSDIKALVVDDEELLVRLQIAFLKRMGITASGVGSGEEGLRYLQGNAVDVVVSDVRMPGTMDGVQLYEWVRENRPELAGRFLFASGDLVGLNLDEFFLKSGAMRIQKPFRFDDYSRAISQALQTGGGPS